MFHSGVGNWRISYAVNSLQAAEVFTPRRVCESMALWIYGCLRIISKTIKFGSVIVLLCKKHFIERPSLLMGKSIHTDAQETIILSDSRRQGSEICPNPSFLWKCARKRRQAICEVKEDSFSQERRFFEAFSRTSGCCFGKRRSWDVTEDADEDVRIFELSDISVWPLLTRLP